MQSTPEDATANGGQEVNENQEGIVDQEVNENQEGIIDQEVNERPEVVTTPSSPTAMDASQKGVMRFGHQASSDLPQSCRPVSDRGRFQEEEEAVRRKAKHSIFWLAIVNGYSALKVFAVHLISLEAMLSIALSVSLTVYVYYKTVGYESLNWSTYYDKVNFSFSYNLLLSPG